MGEEGACQFSDGWLHRFKVRYGIRKLDISGESKSANLPSAEEFVDRFAKIVEEHNLMSEQIYNADETGLFYRCLPRTTLASESGGDVKGFKQSKDRLTVLQGSGIHKTFHNYTVRAKQGGSQGTKDSQSGTAHPKSSGASMRRYNEQSQQQRAEVKEKMEDEHEMSYRATASSHHSTTTHTLTATPLANLSHRRSGMPFTTFATPSHIYLATAIYLTSKEEEFNNKARESKLGEKQPTPKKKKERKPNNARNAERKLKSEKNALDLAGEDSSSESASGSSEEMELVTQMDTFSTTDLSRYHCSVKSKPSPGNTHKTKVWNIIHSACKMGNIDNLSAALKVHSSGQHEGWLLEHSCNPSVIDGAKSYLMMLQTKCRNTFRRFMA
ncbi:hypothetical protein O3P69_011226 [Scylla paramamosain]|uniref:HTH CENPB-type domain-containing protein n=1 Tax=Scylla paramamosain TaxID=85552 RepID=A0AAW0SU49_SCYPA